jgi:hypothetical protein
MWSSIVNDELVVELLQTTTSKTNPHVSYITTLKNGAEKMSTLSTILDMQNPFT